MTGVPAADPDAFSKPFLNKPVLWGGSIALTLGLAAVAVPGVLGALGVAFLLVFLGPAYGIATLVLLRRRRKRESVVPTDVTGAVYKAAHFATVPQVLLLVSEVALLLSIFLVGVAALIASVAPPTPASAYGNFLGWSGIFFLAPAAFISVVALTVSVPYHYARSIAAGEAWALARRAGAWRLIRAARLLNRVALIVFTAGGAALLIWGIISQIETYLYVQNYPRNY